MKRCPYCFEEIQEQAIKCRYCMELLSAPEASTKPIQSEDVKPEKGVTSEIDAHLQAGEDFENRAGGIPEAVNHYFLAAQLSLDSGNEEDCQSFCEHILELNPNDSRATSLLASIDKTVSVSVSTQERSIAPHIEASAAFYEKAEGFRKSGHPSEAFRCYLEAVKLDPDNRPAHFGVKMYVPDHSVPAASVQNVQEPKRKWTSKEQRLGSLISDTRQAEEHRKTGRHSPVDAHLGAKQGVNETEMMNLGSSKQLGGFLFGGGVLLSFLSFSMETAVEVKEAGLKVNNLGLMHSQNMVLMAGIGLSVIGLLILLFAPSSLRLAPSSLQLSIAIEPE